MERKFFTDDFESLLKENADQFRMIPSKKVWHGIYNDTHPGRRWPSVAIGSLFIFTLVVIGYLNNQQSGHSSLTKSKNEAPIIKTASPQDANNSQQTGNPPAAVLNRQVVANQPANRINTTIRQAVGQSTSPAGNQSLRDRNALIAANTPATGQTGNENTTTVTTGVYTASDIDLPVQENQPVINHATYVIPSFTSDNRNTTGIVEPQNAIHKTVLDNSDIAVNQKVTSNLHNQAVPGGVNATSHTSFLKKIYKNSKINWSYYVSPGISYRIYSKKEENANRVMAGLIYNNADLNKAVTHRPSAGFEAGTAMKYAVNKKLKLTSGVQMNYSSYSVEANNIHPIIATLLLYDEKIAIPYSVSSISYYGNGPGTAPIRLHNYDVQVSLPLGIEYKIAGDDNVRFDAAASLQPSFIVTNQAYLLSTDRQNYITQANLSRKWNIGSSLGAFVTVYSKKLQWQVGPQVRYQMLSAYKSDYHLREHFIDYSIRLAVSKSLK